MVPFCSFQVLVPFNRHSAWQEHFYHINGKIQPAFMKKWLSNKTVILILGLFAITGLILVASSLRSLEFKQGTPFTVAWNEPQTISVGKARLSYNLMILLSFTILIAMSILALIVMPPKQRRKFLLVMAIVAVILFISGVIISMGQEMQMELETGYTPTVAPDFDEYVETPIPTVIPSEFAEPQVDPTVSYIVALGITVALALGIWFLLIRRKVRQEPTLEDVAREAIVEIRSGADWSRTVEGAYLRMVDIVHDRRGLARRRDVTPGEFATLLEKIGLPAKAIRRITSLFERVRYGGRDPSPEDIEEAIACLTEIMEACQDVRV